ncbi:hypothetical protein H920_11971 [Fukomys damarensis]|uniref:Uncharacterized protein n=1 Tax=Fukomys damarensis TaxID=885580 RepID=A0A091D670_FUKDA|nr:hypothetical protein H920_11971 [Fukomys damarensis]
MLARVELTSGAQAYLKVQVVTRDWMFPESLVTVNGRRSATLCSSMQFSGEFLECGNFPSFECQKEMAAVPALELRLLRSALRLSPSLVSQLSDRHASWMPSSLCHMGINIPSMELREEPTEVSNKWS